MYNEFLEIVQNHTIDNPLQITLCDNIKLQIYYANNDICFNVLNDCPVSFHDLDGIYLNKILQLIKSQK